MLGINSKSLVKQMYPEDWSSFVARFKKKTRKPYGRRMIDLRPGVADKDRVQTDDDCPQVHMTVMTRPFDFLLQVMHGNFAIILDENVSNRKRCTYCKRISKELNIKLSVKFLYCTCFLSANH